MEREGLGRAAAAMSLLYDDTDGKVENARVIYNSTVLASNETVFVIWLLYCMCCNAC